MRFSATCLDLGNSRRPSHSGDVLVPVDHKVRGSLRRMRRTRLESRVRGLVAERRSDDGQEEVCSHEGCDAAEARREHLASLEPSDGAGGEEAGAGVQCEFSPRDLQSSQRDRSLILAIAVPSRPPPRLACIPLAMQGSRRPGSPYVAPTASIWPPGRCRRSSSAANCNRGLCYHCDLPYLPHVAHKRSQPEAAKAG